MAFGVSRPSWGNFVKGINVLVKNPEQAARTNPIGSAIVSPVLAVPLAPARFVYNPKGFVGPGTGPLYMVLPGPRKGQERLNRVARNPVVDRLSLVTQPTRGENGAPVFKLKAPGASSEQATAFYDNLSFPEFNFPGLSIPKLPNVGQGLLIAGLLVGVVIVAASAAHGAASR